jgi:alkanesulfonate monooxygenase SsuD/methylene tetrahydromethanopterin reductase-like flavin-dependent oxidoreductase (luciferase family)
MTADQEHAEGEKVAHVTFGLFDWIDRGTAPLHQLYEERLQLLEVADAAGFFGYHLAEHHATPLGMAPSPALFLTAAAQRTRRIRLGPLVYLLPLYDPLRLIEEVCMLDHLSGGRLELGVGRGVSPYELGYFGCDAADTRAIFTEALTVLLAGMTHERLTFTGQYYRYHDVPMELRPLQQPYPPLWYPTHNLESVGYAARHGYHFISHGPAAFARQHVDLYWQTWAAHRHEPDRLNGHVAVPKVGIARQVVVADTDAEALAATHAAHRDWYRSITKLWHDHDDHTYDAFFAWELSLQGETILFGSPARVREQMERLLEVSGCNYVICAFAWGTLPHAQTLHSLRLFAEEVMPAFS